MNAIIGITTLMKNELHQPERLAEHLGKLKLPVGCCWASSTIFWT